VTTATTPKTQLQPPFGPSVDSLCHPWFTTTVLSYRFPIFETSATALCGTTGATTIYCVLQPRTLLCPCFSLSCEVELFCRKSTAILSRRSMFSGCFHRTDSLALLTSPVACHLHNHVTRRLPSSARKLLSRVERPVINLWCWCFSILAHTSVLKWMLAVLGVCLDCFTFGCSEAREVFKDPLTDDGKVGPTVEVSNGWIQQINMKKVGKPEKPDFTLYFRFQHWQV